MTDISYFSMKLIEGGSLAQRLPDFATDQRAAARLMAMVARAVHHAHQRGVLHRDLKPSNILLSGGPDTPIGQLEPHVTDFGLAKRVEGDSELTQSGAILGTPSYMAPEQASGKKGVVTVATDVYGLGAVLYAILAGKPPFQGDSVLETIAQVKDRALDPPSSHGRRIDRDLETICLKCLEKEPGRRYGSAEAVAEDLERWLAGDADPGAAGRPSRARLAMVPAQPGGGGADRRCRLACSSWRWSGSSISNRMIARERDEAQATPTVGSPRPAGPPRCRPDVHTVRRRLVGQPAAVGAVAIRVPGRSLAILRGVRPRGGRHLPTSAGRSPWRTAGSARSSSSSTIILRPNRRCAARSKS